MIAKSLELKLPEPNEPLRLLHRELEGSNLYRLDKAEAYSRQRQVLPFGQRGHVWDPLTTPTDPLGIKRGWREKEAGGLLPLVIGWETEDLLTPTTGLDEEELGLPSQAAAAGSIEDVHNFLDRHRTSIRAINSPWELAVAGLEDQESCLQNQEAGVGIQHTVQRLCGAKHLEGPSQGHKADLGSLYSKVSDSRA